MVEVVALDGDDTLWHSESYFTLTHRRFAELLAPHAEPDALEQQLLDVERRNLALFGYGVKGFTLSMIETAIAVSGGTVGADDIATILAWGKEMLAHPVDLLDGVAETVEALARSHRLVLVTKGDLFHQESKVARSGLADRFEHVAIVAEKDGATYRRVMATVGVPPERFLMVGNSVRSDVVPVIDLGGHAVHIPYHTTWELERAVLPVTDDGDRVWELEDIRQLPALVAELSGTRP
ncbi:MAG: HAD family hydrolase [Actinobacteria bacterium]|nr:HAD family hydrolase [Actinomycetota bacterium]